MAKNPAERYPSAPASWPLPPPRRSDETTAEVRTAPTPPVTAPWQAGSPPQHFAPPHGAPSGPGPNRLSRWRIQRADRHLQRWRLFRLRLVGTDGTILRPARQRCAAVRSDTVGRAAAVFRGAVGRARPRHRAAAGTQVAAPALDRCRPGRRAGGRRGHRRHRAVGWRFGAAAYPVPPAPRMRRAAIQLRHGGAPRRPVGCTG